MNKFTELCKEFKIENNNFKKSNDIFRANSIKYKIKQNVKCDHCKKETVVLEDCMCPNCDEDCLLYNVNLNFSRLQIEDGTTVNNYGQWDGANYFKMKIDNYFGIIMFFVYYDPNSGYDNVSKTYWKQPNDWYKTVTIFFDTESERNKIFDQLISEKDSFEVVNSL